MAMAAAINAAITIDYPGEGSVFPPEFPPPTFLFRDAERSAAAWSVEVTFADGSAPIRVPARGEWARAGPLDPRCAGPSNQPPKPPAARTWVADAATWDAIQKHSVSGAATITITGYRGAAAVSRGRVSIRTSRDAVGAPIFYRDVPLMPSETEKGVIKPLAASMLPLVAWRLRDPGQTSSRLLLEGLHSCANCHSFSADGKTMGMDVDGPLNDKGLYAIVPVQPRMSIRNQDVVAWSTFRGKLGGRLRVGFMSQVSPDGRYVATTINDPGQDQPEYQRRISPTDLINNYYVANFKDFSFLQVFYPTRGILAWYDGAAGKLQPLPGASDPRYVHTNAVWSPDGSYLVFSRAAARDAYPAGAQPAARAGDENETQIRYDLYRMAFDGGKGGRPEPIAGASRNGMSNSFPKISPDGRWIVYVQARNGQLMRPDSQLYIVPAAGGTARRMLCNTAPMNSWHSFSPNGRWMVFSSKSRSPYTQMFLTHIDADGTDSPAILIENATAANRAVNIPEFVNVAPGGLLAMEAPVAEYYRVVDEATALDKAGRHEAAALKWKKAVELNPGETTAHFHLGTALARQGRLSEATAEFEKSLELDAAFPNARANLGGVLIQRGMAAQAIAHLEQAILSDPKQADAHNNLGIALAMTGRLAEAIPHVEQAVELAEAKDPTMLDLLAGMYAEAGRLKEAIEVMHRAIRRAGEQKNAPLAESLKAKVAAYQARLDRL